MPHPTAKDTKEKPILFSGEMVRAILDGRKSVTRRIVKPQPPGQPVCSDWSEGWYVDGETWSRPCPFGVPGDRLWVRETFCYSRRNRNGGREVVYRADTSFLSIGEYWRPSIVMPRWASRLTLEIVSVRVERLQEITEEDAKREGVEPVIDYRNAFAIKWDELHFGHADPDHKHGPGSWASNPWCWRIEFRRLP